MANNPQETTKKAVEALHISSLALAKAAEERAAFQAAQTKTAAALSDTSPRIADLLVKHAFIHPDQRDEAIAALQDPAKQANLFEAALNRLTSRAATAQEPGRELPAQTKRAAHGGSIEGKALSAADQAYFAVMNS